MTRPYFVQVLARGQWWDVSRWQHLADALVEAVEFEVCTEYVVRVLHVAELIEWRSDHAWRARALAVAS